MFQSGAPRRFVTRWVGQVYTVRLSRNRGAPEVFPAANVLEALEQLAGHPAVNAAARPEPVLYWHTLSTAEMTPLLEGAPAAADPWFDRLLISDNLASDRRLGSEVRW